MSHINRIKELYEKATDIIKRLLERYDFVDFIFEYKPTIGFYMEVANKSNVDFNKFIYLQNNNTKIKRIKCSIK